MLDEYLAVLLFLALGVGIGAGMLILGHLLPPRAPSPEKEQPYECGFEPFEDARMKFDVRYYLVVILFVLFDLEVAFLFPWAVALEHVGAYGLIAMGVFLLILAIGFVYEWRRGALEWD